MKKLLSFLLITLSAWINIYGQRVTGNNSALLKSEVNTLIAGTVGNSGITTVGTIGTGTWNGSVIGSTYGGTGVNNAGRTLTISTNSGTLNFSGASKTLGIANSVTLNGTDGMNVTFTPTTGKVMVGNGTDMVASTPTLPLTSSPGSGKVLYGDGTNYVLSTPTLPLSSSATSGKIMISDGTNWIASTPTHTTSATLNKVIYGDGTNWVLSTPTIPLNASPGSGKVLYGDGTNYVLSTPTLPLSSSATSGKMMKSDGTNWVASTETYAAPGTTGNYLVSDGTNWIASNPRLNWTSFVVSGSNATTTGQSLVDITGLTSGTLSNSTLYEVEAFLNVTTSAVTTGCQYGIGAGGTGGAAVVVAQLSGSSTSATAASIEGLNAAGTASSTRLTTSGQSGWIYIHGWVTTRGSGTATISIQHLKVTSGTSTVLIGSWFRYRLAN